LAAVAVLVAVAGCQSDSGKKDAAADGKKPASASAAEAPAPTEVIAAAYKKTAAAKSAKVRMTMTMPPAAAGGASEAPSGPMEMSGTMGWDPVVMDMTVDGAALGAADPDMPKEIRMVWVDNVMYMDMGSSAAKDMDGKHWMKLDLGAAAKASGDPAAAEAMTGGLQNMNQDPAQQLALLLESPSLKHLGSEKVDGVQAEHYKGSLTIDEMLKANSSLGGLSAKQRDDLAASAKKSGLKGYDTEVWVNKDNYPVQMNVGMDAPQGEIAIEAHYSDYGAKTTVAAPPAGETFDLMKMLSQISAEAGAGA
jgi:hypothetical protein